MAKKKVAKKVVLKQKNIDRLNELQMKHPGDITDKEKRELQKLESWR